MPQVWVNDASRGKCQLPDGRTVSFNGSGSAAVSDGSSIYVGGKGPVDIPAAASQSLLASTTTESLNPTGGGGSTNVTVNVSGSGATPTGTVTLFVGGSQYAQATLANGQALFSPSILDGFSGATPIYAVYSGDTLYSPSQSASQSFNFHPS